MPIVSETRRLMMAGQMQEAEELCNRLLADKESAVGHQFMGYIAQQTGRHSLSVTSCQRANDLGLEDWSNHLVLGLSLQALGKHDEACNAFEAAHRMSPLNVDAAVFLLEGTLVVHGYEAAEKVHQSFSPSLQAERVDRAWHKIWIENQVAAVQSLMYAGQMDKAEEACRSALRVHPRKEWHRLLNYIEHHKKWLKYKTEKRALSGGSGTATISVMVITYNHEKYIAQALDSILMQETEYELEIIVIEDCSTDKTRDVIMGYVERYPDKIKPFFNPKNIGTLDPPQQKVTHEGFRRLSGDYIAILEGDDYWSSPEKLQKQISFLEAHPDFIACTHNTTKIYDDGSQPPHRFLYWDGTKDVHTVDDFIVCSFFHTSSCIYRNIFQGEPPNFFRSKWSCDIFVNMYYAHHGKVRYFNEDMSVYRAHSGGGYSTMPLIKAHLYNINGLRHFNRWLGFRYFKLFSFNIARRCKILFQEEDIGANRLLSMPARLKYKMVGLGYGFLFELMSHFPLLDPAVFWYGEPLE